MTATLLQPSTMKNHGPFSKGQEGSLDSHPHVIVTRHPTLLPARETERTTRRAGTFIPTQQQQAPLVPTMVISRDTDGMLRPPPILAAEMLLTPFLLRWHHERLVGGLHLCQLLLATGRPPVPNQCQWKSNEELFPPPARKASEKVVGSLGSHPCPAGRRSSATSLGCQQKSTGQSGFPDQQERNKATPSFLCQFSVRGDPPKWEISIKPKVPKHNTQMYSLYRASV